jgi:4-amino-4-deoxy-L-arabinose transferase-like glycosyltransferase
MQAWPGSTSDRTFVVTALAIGLVLRLAWLAVAVKLGRVDMAWDEIGIGRRMATGLGFSFDYYGMFGTLANPSAFFPPAYVYNVFWLWRLFPNVLGLALENVLLSLGAALGLFFLARRLFGSAAARMTLALCLVYPPFITRVQHGPVVYFKLVFIVLTVMAFQKVWTGARTRHAALAGALAGLLALSTPDAVLYLLAFTAALTLFGRRGVARWRNAVVVLGCAALVIAPWTIRNWMSFHEFCLVSANGGFNFYMGNHANSTDEVEFNCIWDLDQRLGGELARADEIGRERILYREGLAWIRANPGEAAGHFLGRAIAHWGFRSSNLADMGLRPESKATRDPGLAFYLWSYLVSYSVVLALAIAGLARCRRRWGEFVPIFLLFLYSTAVSSIFVLQTKQRLAKVDGLLLIFAGYFLVDLGRRLGKSLEEAPGAARAAGDPPGGAACP